MKFVYISMNGFKLFLEGLIEKQEERELEVLPKEIDDLFSELFNFATRNRSHELDNLLSVFARNTKAPLNYLHRNKDTALSNIANNLGGLRERFVTLAFYLRGSRWDDFPVRETKELVDRISRLFDKVSKLRYGAVGEAPFKAISSAKRYTFLLRNKNREITRFPAEHTVGRELVIHNKNVTAIERWLATLDENDTRTVRFIGDVKNKIFLIKLLDGLASAGRTGQQLASALSKEPTDGTRWLIAMDHLEDSGNYQLANEGRPWIEEWFFNKPPTKDSEGDWFHWQPHH
jgi:hypothetical protein